MNQVKNLIIIISQIIFDGPSNNYVIKNPINNCFQLEDDKKCEVIFF
jgi:hypothetical protein